MTDRKMLEQIDACRPASDDVRRIDDGDLQRRLQHDHDARAVYDQIQRFDGKLQMAMQDVETPDGLESRLLARLQQPAVADGDRADALPRPDGLEGAIAGVPNVEPEMDNPLAHTIVAGNRFSRGFWLAVGGVGIAASVLWVFFGNQPVDTWPASTDHLLSESSRVFDTEQRQDGSELGSEPLLATYPVSVDVVAGRGARWRPLTGFFGCNGVGYDLAPRRGATATLYVVRRAGTNLPAGPSFPSATRGTGGLWATAWQRNGLVYVLVVKSGPSSPPDVGSLFLRSSSPV